MFSMRLWSCGQGLDYIDTTCIPKLFISYYNKLRSMQSNRLPWPQQVKWLQKGSSLQSWGSCLSETIWHNPRTFSLFLPFSKGKETFWRVSQPTCLSDLLIDLLEKHLNTWKMAVAENRIVSTVERCKYFWNWCYMTGENTEKFSGRSFAPKVQNKQQPECIALKWREVTYC